MQRLDTRGTAAVRHVSVLATHTRELACALAVIAACTQPLQAAQNDAASNYPSRPLRFIVPYAPGAGTDTTARTLAAKLSERWAQQVVVDNRTGGGGHIGIEYTARANPDGYTVGLLTASHATAQASGQKLGYDITKDLQPITHATSIFYVVYVPVSLPVKSVKELIEYAKANPGKLNYGTSGIGSLQHFAGELLSYMAGLRMVHVVYKGSAPIITAMLANEIHLGFNSMFSVRPQVQAGRIRWIAMTAARRSPTVDLPTMAESGLPGYEVNQWYGVTTSAKVPTSIVLKLNSAINDVLRAPDVVQRLTADGSEIVGGTPEAFGAYIRADIARWSKLITEAHLTLR
jgi:tripartite-type tricarboxylate transporter receptor subunit TctC